MRGERGGGQEVDAISEVFDEALGVMSGVGWLRTDGERSGRTTVLTIRAAVDNNVNDAILSGIRSAWTIGLTAAHISIEW